MWANLKLCFLFTHSQKRFNVAHLTHNLQRRLISWAPVYRAGNWDAGKWSSCSHSSLTCWWNWWQSPICWSQPCITFSSPIHRATAHFSLIILVILVFESRWLWCGAQRLYLLYYQVTNHPCIQGCGRPCGLMCKGISSITCFSCNPVLKMQASKLLIKRLLYNLQKQKHNEFLSCISIRIVINDLLKGKQRNNPPSRYLKERRRKYPSAASDQSIYETNNFWWRQICEVISVLYSKTVFSLLCIPLPYNSPTVSGVILIARHIYCIKKTTKKALLLKLSHRRSLCGMAHGSCFTRIKLILSHSAV